MATKVSSQVMAVTRTTDANGWTVDDFGTFKEYRKPTTFSTVSLTSGQTVGTTLSSSNLPVGMSTLGGNFIECKAIVGSFAMNVNLVPEMGSGSASLALNARNLDSITRAYSGTAYWTIRT